MAASQEEQIKAIKKSLRQANPKWSEEKVVESAYKIFNSRKTKSEKKETSYSAVEGIDFKQSDEGTFYSKGYVATTDFDRVGDILTLHALENACEQINNLKQIDSDEVSYRHDRSDPKPIAIAEHNASVVNLGDDRYGLQVTTNHTKTHPKYDEYVYDVSNGVVKGYSIEYEPRVVLEDTREFDSEGSVISGFRIIDEFDMRGYGYASGRFIANPQARLIETGYKEISKTIILNSKEDSYDKDSDDKDDSEEDKKKKKSKNMEEHKMAENEVKEMSAEDKLLLSEIKEMKAREIKQKEFMTFLQDVKVKEALKALDVESKPLNSKESDVKESSIEMKELKQVLSSKEMDLDERFKRAGLIAEKMGLKHSIPSSKERMSVKQFGTNGSKLEYKGLAITSNQNTDTDYLLSAAELSDVFDPLIWDALNQSTLTWGLLRKDDFSNKGNNQVQFILETAVNPTAGFYTGNSVATSFSTLQKYQTKFKKVQVGVAIDGDMIAAARGSPTGDVLGLHIRLATKTLLNTINAALFAEVGLETAAAIIGFEYLADSAGNTTLYNVTRTSANGLAPATAGDTYINGASARISLDNMRAAIQNAVVNGADINNLVFITHPTQERLFKGIYDGLQRLMPTSSRFGFTGRPEFDSVPIFADKDCTSDNWHLVDLESHRVAIWVPPTVEVLGKRSDAEEVFIKSYIAVYNTAPKRVAMIYDNATS